MCVCVCVCVCRLLGYNRMCMAGFKIYFSYVHVSANV